MLDIHAVYDGTGHTALTAQTTGFTNDPATITANSGIIPLQPIATLVGYGAGAIAVADAVKELFLTSPDQIDPNNGWDYKMAGTSTQILSPVMFPRLKYVSGGRVIKTAQAAAGALAAYTIDHYDSANPVSGSYGFDGQYTVTGTVNVAGAWTSTVVTSAIPVGKWAILGVLGENMTTTTGFNLVKFQHAAFGAYQPGFPILDVANGTLTTANFGGLTDFLTNGFQFVDMSRITGKPQCPTFNVTAQSVGLTMWTGSVNTDTPNIILNLQKVG